MLLVVVATSEAFAISWFAHFDVHAGVSSGQSGSVTVIAMSQRHCPFPQKGFSAAHAFLHITKGQYAATTTTLGPIEIDSLLLWGIQKDEQLMAGLGKHKILHILKRPRRLHKSLQGFPHRNTPLLKFLFFKDLVLKMSCFFSIFNCGNWFTFGDVDVWRKGFASTTQ